MRNRRSTPYPVSGYAGADLNRDAGDWAQPAEERLRQIIRERDALIAELEARLARYEGQRPERLGLVRRPA